jgi:hypothetical protein
MIIPGNRKTVSVILDRMKPDGSERMGEMKPEEEMEEGSSAMKAICEDMIMAFESKSAHDLMEAMKAFHHEMRNQEME